MYRRLAEDDRQQLAQVSQLRKYAKGDRIFGEGDPSDFFSVVVSGRVKIVKMTPAGKDVILEIFSTGDPFGAVAAYEGRPFPASAIALEETVCLLTPRRQFFSAARSASFPGQRPAAGTDAASGRAHEPTH